MSFLDYLREQKSSPVSVRHQFTLAYKAGTKDIYVFFEGDDDRAFFMPEIRRRVGSLGDIHDFSCGGKRGVLEAFEHVSVRIDNIRRALFFLDKDLDDFLDVDTPDSESIFITQCYSIENLWVTEAELRRVWAEFFRLSSRDERLDMACHEFKRAYQRFVAIALTMMAWVIAERRAARPVRLNDANLARVVSVDEDLAVRKVNGGLREFRRVCGSNGGQSGWRVVRKVRTEIEKVPAKTVIRGKYELWFFVRFLNRLEEALRRKDSAGSKPRNRVSMSLANAVDLLASRYVFGDDVKDFIDGNLSQI
ncbi:MAG: DUF4435 domain-containing protein [Gammaproteobacteria bacterium]|nr:DUF4435 domain-containing protein [Gammaproteobacteria bacterium]